MSAERRMLEYWTYHMLSGKPNKDTYSAMQELTDESRDSRLDRFASTYLNRAAFEGYKVLKRYVEEIEADRD